MLKKTKPNAKCVECRGDGVLKKSNGQKIRCYHCRGTGKADKGYLTK